MNYATSLEMRSLSTALLDEWCCSSSWMTWLLHPRNPPYHHPIRAISPRTKQNTTVNQKFVTLLLLQEIFDGLVMTHSLWSLFQGQEYHSNVSKMYTVPFLNCASLRDCNSFSKVSICSFFASKTINLFSSSNLSWVAFARAKAA